MAKGKQAVNKVEIDEDWQCQSDADALVRAAEVVADKGRFEKAKAHIKKKQVGLDRMFKGLRR